MFLKPGSDPFAACFCGMGRGCWKCNGAIRAFINDESAERLKSITMGTITHFTA
jgi:hypothetical protein